MAQTLFERLAYGKTKPEDTIYNPLEAKVGNRFRIDTIELRAGGPYVLRGLAEYTRKENGKERKFTDYLFEGFRLRIIPCARVTRQPLQFNCYLLKDNAKEGWIPELYENLCDRSGEFNIHHDGVEDKYFRFLSEGEKQAGSPHTAKVRELFDENLDGKVQENEISSTEMEYFDYFRELSDEANQKYNELLFVEHNLQDKTFLFLVGAEVIPERVTCL